MDAKAVLRLQLDEVRKLVNRAETGVTDSRNYGTYVTCLQQYFQRRQIEACVSIRRYRREGQAENLADATVCVM